MSVKTPDINSLKKASKAVQEATLAAKVKQWNKELKAAEKEAKKYGESVVAYLNEEMKSAASKGYTNVSYRGDTSRAASDGLRWAASYFIGHGFKAKVYVDEYDMGDNEYPCPMAETVLSVSWGD